MKSISLEAASADKNAAEAYICETFDEIIAKGEYRPEQVFNMDKTGLYWKQMPSQKILFKDKEKASAFKACKDHVTLLMCSNAVGFLLNPALIYKSRSPRALKIRIKICYLRIGCTIQLPRKNPLSSDWLYHSFIPQVKIYL